MTLVVKNSNGLVVSLLPIPINTLPPLSLPEVSNVSEVSAPDTKMADTLELAIEMCPPKCPPNSEASSGVTADTMDGADTILEKRGIRLLR